ncbi:MAG: transposase [Polyangiaceae bacterium]
MLRYPERVQRLKPESPTMRMLRQLVETRRGLVEDRVRVTNRIVANLKAYFPQVLGLFREKDTGVFADFLERWPSLEAAKKARRSALESFFREHNVRYQSTIDRRIDTLKGEEPLTTDEAVIRPAQLLVELSLLQRAASERRRISRVRRRCPRHRSGNKCWVHWRYSCSTFLRQTFVEWVAEPSLAPPGPRPSTRHIGPAVARTKPPFEP